MLPNAAVVRCEFCCMRTKVGGRWRLLRAYYVTAFRVASCYLIHTMPIGGFWSSSFKDREKKKEQGYNLLFFFFGWVLLIWFYLATSVKTSVQKPQNSGLRKTKNVLPLHKWTWAVDHPQVRWSCARLPAPRSSDISVEQSRSCHQGWNHSHHCNIPSGRMEEERYRADPLLLITVDTADSILSGHWPELDHMAT